MAGKKETKSKYQLYIPQAKKIPDWYKNFNFVLVNSMRDLEEIFSGLEDKSYYMSFDTETTGLDFEELELVGYSFCLDGKTAYYVPVYHFEYKGNLGEESVKFIYEKMCGAKKVFMFNARYDMRVFEYYGFKNLSDEDKKKRFRYVKYDMSKVDYFDVAVSVWAGDTNWKMPSLKASSLRILGIEQIHFDEVIEEAGNFFYLDPSSNPDTVFYAAADALCTYLLVPATMKYFNEGGLATKVDNKVLYPLMHYEAEKMYLEGDRIDEMLEEATAEVDRLEKEVYDMIGYQINLNSPIQVAQAFQRLGIDTGERTETGNMATGMKVLENLSDEVKDKYPALKSFVKYKETFKLVSSYISVFKKIYENKGYLRGAYQTTNVPCLTENNYVYIKGSGMVSIKDVVEGDYIWTQYGYKKVLWNNSHFSDDVYRLTLRDGSFIEGTGHHPILVNLTGKKSKIIPEWSALIAVKEGERVIENSHTVETDKIEIPVPTFVWEGRNKLRKEIKYPEYMSEKLARMIGFLDGDGCLLDDRVRLAFNSTEKEIIEYYSSLFEELFDGIGEPNIYVDGNSTTYDYFSKGLLGYLRNLNVRESKEPGVSKYIKHSGSDIWASYLCGIWDTDGCLTKSGTVGKIFQPRVKMVKKDTMVDIFYLLKGLSIDTSIHPLVSNEGYKTQYEVHCINYRGIVLFHDFIGSRLVHKKRRERSCFNRSYVKKYFDIAHSIFEGDIVKISPTIVYDIEVEDVHEYVANGIVTHNTGRLSAGKDGKNTFFSPVNVQALPKPHVMMYDVFDMGDMNMFSKKDNILLGYKFVPAQYHTDENGKKVHTVPTDDNYIGWAEGMDPHLNVRSLITPRFYEDSKDDDYVYVAADYCISPDTLVELEDGSKIKLSDLDGKNGIKIKTPYGFHEAKNFHYTGKRQVCILKLKSGKTIKCSPDHKFFVRTEEGTDMWKALKDIKMSDYVYEDKI